MHLFVVRHAIAEERQPDQQDPDRALTKDGERKLRAAVRGMRALEWRFERVLASPWARAARTAELLAPVSEQAPIVTELLCQPPRKELLALISEGSGATTAVVGHEPWLGELVALLAFGDGRHGEALELRKSGVVWLEGTVVPAGMLLRAIVPPKLLRAVR